MPADLFETKVSQVSNRGRFKKTTGVLPHPQEKGVYIKNRGGRIPVCVVYPNRYYIGMSNLAVHMIYSTLNRMPDVWCERSFLEEGRIQPISIESKSPLTSFAILFFTISYELDYLNIPMILKASSITLKRDERREAEPIIVAGGITVMANPEPLAAFFDLFLLGDIEVVIPPFMERYIEASGKARGEIIEVLSTFDWAYNPDQLTISYNEDGRIGAFKPANFKKRVAYYEGNTLGRSAIITEGTEFSRMFLVEGTRGCPSSCPFCLIGNVYRFIYDSLDDIETDEKEIGIIGGGVSFHPHLIDVIEGLRAEGRHIHLPSLRIEKVSIPLLEFLKTDIKTLTFGIEAGSEQLRRLIGKPMTDDEILGKMEVILALRPFNLKLYFMIGLYTETEEDIDAIVGLVKRIRHVMVKSGSKRGTVGQITVHISPFVPKPATPFQWLPMADMASLKEKIKRLGRAIRKVGNTYFTHESIKYSFVQGILSRGDRRLAPMIIRLAQGEAITRLLREEYLNLNPYCLRERVEEEVFPWDFIEGRAKKEQLYLGLKACLSRLCPASKKVLRLNHLSKE
jgi:radical SAM superfamily enzyme YgiQ (UPF0313 family)